MTAYIALLRKDGDSDYGVEFPDFPGCVTAGTSLEDVRHMAAEVLTFHVVGMAADQDPLPPPASLDTVMDQAENRDAIAFLVEVPTRPAQAIRLNIMLPGDLVAAIDRTAPNRSHLLAEVARAKLREVS